jgi:hypothetical protein
VFFVIRTFVNDVGGEEAQSRGENRLYEKNEEICLMYSDYCLCKCSHLAYERTNYEFNE